MAGDGWKGKEKETEEFIIRSGVHPFFKRELEFTLSSQRQLLNLPRTRTRRSAKEKKPTTSIDFSLNPVPAIGVGAMAPPPSTIHYNGNDQSHTLSSWELAMAFGLPTPPTESETPVLEKCDKVLLEKMMMARATERSTGSVAEANSSCLTSTVMDSELDEVVGVMNPDLRMFNNFLSNDFQKNPRDHLATGMLDRKSLKYAPSKH